jgi:HAD superfamily hydrolase (TIGR01490 family)
VPRVAAFFDMDRTLLRCNTGERWVRFLRRRGEIQLYEMIRAFSWLAQYKLAVLDMPRVTARVVAQMAGDLEDEMIAKCEEWVATEILAEVAPSARTAIAHHRASGHEVTILSTSTPYITQPLARALGMDPAKVLCTRLRVEAGRFTGHVIEPVCYGLGKVHWAERFAADHGVDLDASWFYTDSFSDLPMLQRVGQRVVVNPDPRLRRHARRVGWPVEEW